MLVLSQRLLECPVMSLQTGAQIGATVEAIIDPRQLTMTAFTCEGPQIEFSPAILHTNDIREFGPMGIIVNSSDDLMSPDDLVRLQEVLDFNFVLMDKPVIDELGHKLGKVCNYSLETDSFYIMKIHVKQSLLKSFSVAELIIDRTQISEITDKRIVVNSTMTKHVSEAPVPKRKPIENPFRQNPNPQPEAIKPDNN